MPIREMPATVAQAWGENVSRDFARWLEVVLTETAVSRPEWVDVSTRLGVIEHDVADIKAELAAFRREVADRFDRFSAELDRRIEQTIGRSDARTDDVAARSDARMHEVMARSDARVDAVIERFDARFDEMDARFDELGRQMLAQTRWTVGLLAVFGTIVAALVGIGQLGP